MGPKKDAQGKRERAVGYCDMCVRLSSAFRGPRILRPFYGAADQLKREERCRQYSIRNAECSEGTHRKWSYFYRSAGEMKNITGSSEASFKPGRVKRDLQEAADAIHEIRALPAVQRHKELDEPLRQAEEWARKEYRKVREWNGDPDTNVNDTNPHC